MSAEWQPLAVGALPDRPGVYVISSENRHYVGLAFDIRHRFLNPLYGHLSAQNKSRSHSLVANRPFEIRAVVLLDQSPNLAARDPASRLRLATTEIQTYFELTLEGRRPVNVAGLLGRLGQSPGSPVFLCDCASGEYVYCNSLIPAVRFVHSNALPAVLYGYQRTAAGFAARWATIAEAETLSDTGDSEVIRGPEVEAVASEVPSSVTWSGATRTASFEWRAGPLRSSDLHRLKQPPARALLGVASIQFVPRCLLAPASAGMAVPGQDRVRS